jgi:uncharacterized protein YjiS (DUF1127 family)
MATLKDKLTARNGQRIETRLAQIFGRDTLSVSQERDRAADLIAEARVRQAEMIGRALARAGRPLGRLFARLAEAHRARESARELSQLDDRMLSDIGICRADIGALAHRMAESGNDNYPGDRRHIA